MTEDECAIREVVATWMSASKAGDIDTVLKLMSDDVVFLIAGQPPMLGKAAYAAAAQPQTKAEGPKVDGQSEIQEVKVLGDWAFMWTKLTVHVQMPGQPEPTIRAGHTLTILQKQSGKWLLARDANMLAPVQKT
jgi:uncharacterized protein (TIGR02246 family)